MRTPPAGTRWVRRPDTLWRAVNDTLVVFPASVDDPSIVTAPGLAVWHLLEHPQPQAAVVDVLVDAFDADPVEVEHDVGSLLEGLLAMGAVERVA